MLRGLYIIFIKINSPFNLTIQCINALFYKNYYYLFNITTSQMIALKVLLNLFNMPASTFQTDDLEVVALVEKLLISIHPTLFQPLYHFDFSRMSKEHILLEIISLIGNYLNSIEYKRLNKDFEKRILNSIDMSRLIGLSIYISIDSKSSSQIKNQVIGVILSLDELQQQQIMDMMTQIDSQCQDLLQLQKAISRIGVLEEQNDLLKQKIINQLNITGIQSCKIREIQSQHQQLLKQIKQYKQQKNIVFTQLEISNIGQYLAICSQIKAKNNICSQRIQEMQNDRASAVSYNLVIKKQLKKKGKVIQNQIQSIQSLKKMCKELNLDEYLRLEKNFQGNVVHIPLLPLEENNNAKNIQKITQCQRYQIQTDRTACSTKRQDGEQEQQRYNLQRLLTLKRLQVQQTQKMKAIEVLKERYEVELLKEKKIKYQMRKLMIQHQRYMHSYSLLKIS